MITPSRRLHLPIVLRELEVLRTRAVTPRMRRITLGGPQLGAFRANGFDLPAFTTEGADDYVKVFLADGPQAGPVLPEQHDGHLHWPRKPAPTARAYTVRRFDAEQRELDLDFVLHGHGVAGTWARSAAVGDTLHLAGPKIATLPPRGADWWLLAGDDTALPAISRYLEETHDVPVHAAILVENADEEQPDLPGVTWVHRKAGTTAAALLAEAAARIAPRSGTGWMWIAGETDIVRSLRAVASDLGIPRDLLDASGYWRAPSTGRTPLGRVRTLRESARESLDLRRREHIGKPAH
ncbi:Fe-utilization protein [Rhodococcus rhodnii LMG 5362]|uniref:Fe-utilization protein n=1 Tax=Rhodococcus rhodnii LMG 5362 TaxID=1273125 RepID=R7WK04_9NOCA|nr:Fe-utilization protein [Rhodococcus rhodnii LMG 5362]